MTKGFSKTESDRHVIGKQALYVTLLKHSSVTKLEFERNLGTVRPDISAYIGKHPVAVEIQVSGLTKDEIVHRTNEYTKKGIYVLWVCANYYITGSYETVDKWMRFLHGLYYGWMFYPRIDGMLIATKTKATFSNSRYLKTTRDVVEQSVKHIVDDFKPEYRKPFHGFPEAMLWIPK